jgi:hypothetical protein
VSRIKSPVEDALRAAVRDRLWSLVYSALNTALDYYHDPKELRRDWCDIGAYGVAELLVLSASSDTRDWSSYPRMLTNPWEAQFLRRCAPGEIVFIVSEWLDRKPLDPRINEDPEEEDRKVRNLKSLLYRLNE